MELNRILDEDDIINNFELMGIILMYYIVFWYFF